MACKRVTHNFRLSVSVFIKWHNHVQSKNQTKYWNTRWACNNAKAKYGNSVWIVVEQQRTGSYQREVSTNGKHHTYDELVQNFLQSNTATIVVETYQIIGQWNAVPDVFCSKEMDNVDGHIRWFQVRMPWKASGQTSSGRTKYQIWQLVWEKQFNATGNDENYVLIVCRYLREPNKN